ncbi:MAG: M42 family peptidase, partial [Deltaproteobacteria bacterium]|nr:M42 family peptidase [Deltaproteobacteria bacterium]
IYGSTNAGAIHLTRKGVITGVISIPCRYIHSPNLIMNMEDFTNTVKLLVAVSQRCKKVF